MIKLIIGLGNSGKEYVNTKHNIGFMALDFYVEKKGLSFDRKKYNGLFLEFNINNNKIILLKPLSYMNLSGEVIIEFIKFYKINLTDILVICDDLNLPFAKLRVRQKGSSGGHNGLKNIENHLHCQDYKRVKIGIGHDFDYDMKNFVLSKFNNNELKELNVSFEKVTEIIDDFSKNVDFERIMCKYN